MLYEWKGTPIYSYISLFLLSNLFFEQLSNVSGTTTINQLTQGNFNAFFVPIPPLAEQSRICLKVKKILDIIEKGEI